MRRRTSDTLTTMSICFISDLHLGRDPAKTWAEPVTWLTPAEILTRLKRVLLSEQINLLVVGGDMIEHGDAARIDEFVDLMKPIYVPTLVCFGNHDLTMPESMPHWRKAIARWPQATMADAMLPAGEFDVIALNTHWIVDDQVRVDWTPGKPCWPAIIDGQRAWLRETVSDSDRPALLVCHAPVHMVAPGEAPDGMTALRTRAYRDAIEAELVRSGRGERVIGVLSGHIHLASTVHGSAHSPRTLLTSAALSESPCSVRLVRLVDGHLAIRNVSLES